MLAETETSQDTLKELDLSGCSFVNKACLDHIMQFNCLEKLSVAHCRGLDGTMLSGLDKWKEKNLAHLKELDVSGILMSHKQLEVRFSD